MYTTKLSFRHNVISIALTLILTISCAFNSYSQYRALKSIHVGLIYPISSHGSHAREYSNTFSLHLISGVSRTERGLSMSGITNVIKENAEGLQVAGVSNHVADTVKSVLIAGVINTYSDANGLQIAGFANLAKRNIKGTQVAGFLNCAGNINGIQVGGFMNNVTTVDGMQMAGFINIAKTVRGVQLAGFINIADSSEYPIGIINIIKNGEKNISITTDETLTTLASFRSGSKLLYGILGIGYNLKNKSETYALEAGIGANLITRTHFRLSAEAVTITLTAFNSGSYVKNSLRIMPALKITDNIEIFGGPSVNYIHTNTLDGRELMEHDIWNNGHNNLHGLTIGATGGLRYVLK